VKWVTALELETWASTINARSELADVIADLIRASVKDITSFRFPRGDSGQLQGWDGVVESTGASPYVPAGQSAWELGTGSRVIQKADEDYRTRTQNPRGLNPQECTFVAVTARQWDPAKLGKTTEEWREEKLTRREWKDVMIMDAGSMEEWLNQN